ncbi:hemolysin D [Rhodoblastus acidophilus]|uniref:HlyD family type I secretion periplasmic adaptor subunit n=1 Tax=Rhodoblastus acidophilus TaxID=1074 RepID=UPI00222427B7|nr:HlyD family type I secretion periplasmic adaptor subunit [Rhodoblastus acidophilus]MCW2318209.1 hemolysin D [Rhodoblastus acidophilus]
MTARALLNKLRAGLEPAPSLPSLTRYDTHAADMEFHPADIEILDTPPSPVRMGMIVTICALATAALAWSYFGKIDIVAVAQGKFKPVGDTKIIQPLEGGKVAALHVENGQHVKAGDILVELDPGDARADETDAAATLAAWRAEALRRRAAIDAAPKTSEPAAIFWPADIPPANRAREEKVLDSDLAQLASALASLDAQIAQKETERDQLAATIASQQALIATLRQRVDMRAALVPSGAGSKASVIDATERMQSETTALNGQIAQRAQTIAAIKVLTEDRRKTISSFVAENTQKLADAQRQTDDFEQKHIKTRLKSGRLALTSPIDGVVMGLSVTTIGQVLGSGEDVAKIVPEGARLKIEAYLANKDIGFVKKGQAAVVKVDAFPFTRYGSLAATVERIAFDAIPEPDAQNAEADATKSNRNARTFAGAQRVQNLVFPVTLTPESDHLAIEGERIPMSPGMTVEIEIATGKRRILEYVFSPLVETASKALKER